MIPLNVVLLYYRMFWDLFRFYMAMETLRWQVAVLAHIGMFFTE